MFSQIRITVIGKAAGELANYTGNLFNLPQQQAAGVG